MQLKCAVTCAVQVIVIDLQTGFVVSLSWSIDRADLQLRLLRFFITTVLRSAICGQCPPIIFFVLNLQPGTVSPLAGSSVQNKVTAVFQKYMHFDIMTTSLEF